jgi:hypothetical protein
MKGENTLDKTIKYIYTGSCPYTSSPQAITIDYFEIPIAGNLLPGYKKSVYSCPLFNECPYPKQDQYRRCPVYLSAPNEPYSI